MKNNNYNYDQNTTGEQKRKKMWKLIKYAVLVCVIVFVKEILTSDEESR